MQDKKKVWLPSFQSTSDTGNIRIHGSWANWCTAAIDRLEESIHHIQQTELPTIEAIVAEKRARAAARAAEDKAKAKAAAAAEAAAAAAPTSDASAESEGSVAAAPATEQGTEGEDEGEVQGGSLGDLEAEAGQEGAFNPETGEINWDCPCLGGMAHGPCGEEFREAFSCFVHSTEEPKGMECIEKFKYVFECYWSADPALGIEEVE